MEICAGKIVDFEFRCSLLMEFGFWDLKIHRDKKTYISLLPTYICVIFVFMNWIALVLYRFESFIERWVDTGITVFTYSVSHNPIRRLSIRREIAIIKAVCVWNVKLCVLHIYTYNLLRSAYHIWELYLSLTIYSSRKKGFISKKTEDKGLYI